MADAPAVAVRPAWKWAGGKTKLLPVLRAYVPSAFHWYHEPFFGGGALFWDLASSGRLSEGRIRLSDANPVLVRVLHALKTNVEAVITALDAMPVTATYYASIRGTTPEVRAAFSDVELAAWFIYVNKTCFNGVYRVNKTGKFNVPWGKWEESKRTPCTCDKPLLRACARALNRWNAELSSESFETVLTHAGAEDFVYFDPPYMPISKTADFTSYTQERFGYEDHIRLRDVALELKDRGVHVLLSNADVPAVRELYDPKLGFLVDEVLAARSVNSKGDRRGAAKELVIR